MYDAEREAERVGYHSIIAALVDRLSRLEGMADQDYKIIVGDDEITSPPDVGIMRTDDGVTLTLRRNPITPTDVELYGPKAQLLMDRITGLSQADAIQAVKALDHMDYR